MATLSAIITPNNVLTATSTATLTNKTINIASNTLTGVQPTLVSGTSLKTINSFSLLGSGDITIGATGGGTDAALYENDLLGTANYTIGQAAMVSGATITIATPAVISIANTFAVGQPVRFTTTGALPTGLSTTAAYYVTTAGAAFQVSTTVGGTAVATSGTQSGVHSVGKIKNAATVGPFSVVSGVAYTVPSGSRWVVS